MKYLEEHKKALLNCVLTCLKLFPNTQNCLSIFTDQIDTVNNLKELKEISITLLIEVDQFIKTSSNKLEIYIFMTHFSYLLNKITPYEYYYDLLIEHVAKKCEDEDYTWYKEASELNQLISKIDQDKNIVTLKENVLLFCSKKLRGWVYSSHDLRGKIESMLSEISIGNSTYEYISAKYQLLPFDVYIPPPAPIHLPLPPPSIFYSNSCPSTIKYNDSQSTIEHSLEKISLKKSMN